MKIDINFENLDKIIEDVIKHNTGEIIEDWVRQTVQSTLERDYKDIIENKVHEEIKTAIDSYINNYKISLGNPLAGEDIQYFTPHEYINYTIANVFDKKVLTEEVTDSWSGRKEKKETSFEDFLKSKFDFTKTIKMYMDDFAKDLRLQINSLLKESYNKATRDAISDVVLDTIMENDKFKSISNNLKRLGEG